MINNISYLPSLGKSDHLVLIFKFFCYTEQQISSFTKLNYFKGNYEEMSLSLGTMDWVSLLYGLDGNGSFRSYSRSDPGSFRSYSLSVRSFRPDLRGGSVRPNFGGSFRPTLFYIVFRLQKVFLASPIDFMQL